MRALIVHRYFWPDTAPQATILRSIAAQWARDGHDVTVLSAQPGYTSEVSDQAQAPREVLDGVLVIRRALFSESKTAYLRRSLNYLVFFVGAAAHIVRRRYDVVVGLTAPPVVPGVVLGTAARLAGSRYVYYCVDIHPEISRVTGLIADGWWFRVLRALDRRAVRRSAAVVVISDDMWTEQLERGAKPDRLRLIREPDLEEFSDADEQLPQPLQSRGVVFRLLFTGNLGQFQDLRTVIEAARRLGPYGGVSFEFLGSGLLEAELRVRAGGLVGRTVFFHGRVSPRVARLAAESASACLVSLSPGVVRYAFPAKLVSYLKAGAPIVALVDPDSSLAGLVRERGLGVVAKPGDVEDLIRSIKELSAADLQAVRERSTNAGRELFSRSSILEAWSAFGAELAGRPDGETG